MKKSFIWRVIREGIVDTAKYRYYADMRDYEPMDGSLWEIESGIFDIMRIDKSRIGHLLDDWAWDRVLRVKYLNPKIGPSELIILDSDADVR